MANGKVNLSKSKQIVLFYLLDTLFKKFGKICISDVDITISRDFLAELSDLYLDLKISLNK